MDSIIIQPNSCVLCYLEAGSERSFVSEELILIPKDVEVPSEYVKVW